MTNAFDVGYQNAVYLLEHGERAITLSFVGQDALDYADGWACAMTDHDDTDNAE